MKKRLFLHLGIIVFAALLLANCKSPDEPDDQPGSKETNQKGSAVVSIAAIQGLRAPVTGGTPVLAITSTEQYSGTVVWTPAHSSFQVSTVYIAIVTLEPKTGYTFNGVPANFFTAAGADSVRNDANSGVVTAVFPATVETIVSSTGIVMVRVPGGSFQMGNPDTSDERPVHTVTLTGFYMGKYPVTQAQYQSVMGSNPSYFSSDPASGEVQENRPVECVSWYDAIEFCNALSIKEGLSPYYTIDEVNKDPNNTNGWDDMKWTVTCNSMANGYRLPTEAQWEYAAKGGNGTPGNYTYAGSNTVGDVAWYYNNSNNMTHEVGKKQPNGLGIYDMSGNVWEWCWDWYKGYSSGAQTDPQGAASGDYRVLRGGSWNSNASRARSVYRIDYSPSSRYYNLGFRLVRP